MFETLEKGLFLSKAFIMKNLLTWASAHPVLATLGVVAIIALVVAIIKAVTSKPVTPVQPTAPVAPQRIMVPVNSGFVNAGGIGNAGSGMGGGNAGRMSGGGNARH